MGFSGPVGLYTFCLMLLTVIVSKSDARGPLVIPVHGAAVSFRQGSVWSMFYWPGWFYGKVCFCVGPEGNAACFRPLQAFFMLARDIMSRLNRKMVGWMPSGGLLWVYVQATLPVLHLPPKLIGSRFPPFASQQNDSSPPGGGGAVKITESRSRKSLFKCLLL